NVANATVGVSIDAGALTAQSALDVTLARGANFLSLGAGNDRVVLLGNYVAGTYNTTENGVNLNAQSTATAVARVVTDTINLGTGNDTLVTYGAINLAGAQLSGIENITANSAVVITASQYAALVAARAALSLSTPVITFTGNVPHQLTIVDDIAGVNNIDLSLIAVTSGTLVIDTTSSSNATGGGVNNTTVSNAVTVSGGATVTTGVVGTNPVNGGGTALTPTAFVAGGNYASAVNVNDNFTGTVANLSGTTISGNVGDTDTITLTGNSSITGFGNGTTGGIITNIKSLITDNTGGTITFGATTTGVTTVTGGTGVDNVDVTGAGTSFLAGNVNLGAGAGQTLTLGAFAYTGTFSAGAGVTDTLALAAGANISGANITGFENLTLAATGNYTLTAAQYNAFTGTISAGNTETLTFTTAGTIVANNAIERFTLAAGTNTFTAGTNTVSVVGGTGNDTFNYTATQIAGATTLDGGLGIDTLNIGAIGANLNITALVTGIETVNVTGSAATGWTFTNENGAGVTLNFAKGAFADTVVLGSGGQTVNLLGTAATNVTVTGNATGVDTINLSTTATGVETITAGSNIAAIDTVANFKVAGADVFKTGTAATSLNLLSIATADISTLAAAIATAATGAGAALAANTQAYIITVAAGTAAGTYAFQNIGGTVGAVDATDFIVKITGAGSIVAGDFIA
ncbi:beta strand repeat-containing protein, partial [Undibacterium sp. TC4M20W]|uniref:beta strand repeat-containing protein n=1 Tax=Undibacterium sp. TC4M20W TaxID=3413052 RepID=UPI003BF1FD6C